MTVPDPWDQQADEGAKPYAAFRAYCSMPVLERSNAAVARALRRSKQLIDRWSAAHHWQDRIRAYDAFIERSELAELQAARKDMRARHVAAAKIMFAKCREGIKVLRGRRLSAANLAKLLDVSARLERDALGPSHGDDECAQVVINVRERTAADDI